MIEFQVRKDNFAKTQLVESAVAPINDGEVRLAVNKFSFTANNITYAMMGERLSYWQFFPAIGDDAQAWGVIPVWGFATVIESKSSEIPVGERLFGYFPPASEVAITPVKVGQTTLFDGAAHRAELPAGYNVYRRVTAEPGYDASMDQDRMLLYPLYVTSFCLHDMLQDNAWYDAEQVVIVSASSKTSIGLAYALDEDQNAPKIVGITSQRNVELVKKLGLYDTVLSYQQLDQIDTTKKTTIVDMSANAQVLGKLHTLLGDNMRFCSNVGLTHWDEAGAAEGIISERSEMFFAPSHIQKRMQDWGAEGFQTRSSEFINRTALKSRTWLEMKTIDGIQGLSDIYPDVCDGRMPPEQGLIIEF
jgi:hypothetical protein